LYRSMASVHASSAAFQLLSVSIAHETVTRRSATQHAVHGWLQLQRQLATVTGGCGGTGFHLPVFKANTRDCAG
jgi:hypothetical protein